MKTTFPSIQPLRSRQFLLRDLSRAFLIACLLITATKAKAEYTFTLIADSTGPFGNFGTTSPVSLNASGTVAFSALLDNGSRGVFTGNGGPTTTVTISAMPFASFGAPSINQAGTVAFYGKQATGVGEGIFAGNGGPLLTIADTAGQFDSFGGYTSINAAGKVAFVADQDSGPIGIFVGDGGVATPIVINSVSLNRVSSASIHDAGTVAFKAFLGQGNLSMGIFTSNGGPIATIADSSGLLKSFGNTPSINSAGTVAFVGGLDFDSAAFGIYTGNGGPLMTIADLSGPFSYFDFNLNLPSINGAGTVAFMASLDSGGFGIYIGDGADTSEVIGSGDPLFGSTITSLNISPTSFNDLGQVAFGYTLANGATGIAIANPVPEPSSSLLLALLLGLSLARRTTRKC